MFKLHVTWGWAGAVDLSCHEDGCEVPLLKSPFLVRVDFLLYVLTV